MQPTFITSLKTFLKLLNFRQLKPGLLHKDFLALQIITFYIFHTLSSVTISAQLFYFYYYNLC